MTEVSDYSALLAANQDANARWNSFAELGTPVVVSYSFLVDSNLPEPDDGAYSVEGYHRFGPAQRANFRDALSIYAANTGAVFVEVESGTGMLDVYRATGSSYGGWAHMPSVSESWIYRGDLVIDNKGAYHEGSYGFLTILHELGHALGLKHPHQGATTLAEDVDDLSHTVMTYNIAAPYSEDLAPFDTSALQHLYGFAQDDPDRKIFWHTRLKRLEAHLGDGDDVLVGIDQPNRILGGGGHDSLWGRGGDDTLNGQSGSDLLQGLGGDDILRGMAGRDTIYGNLAGASFPVSDRDRIFGGNGRDSLFGQHGEDRIFGDGDSDWLYGGPDDDSLAGRNGHDIIYGGQDDDSIAGGNGHDIIYGGTGEDRMNGGPGADQLFGGEGKDRLFGGIGADVLHADADRDTLWGGSDADVFVLDVPSNGLVGRDLIPDFEPSKDMFSLVETGYDWSDVRILERGPEYLQIMVGFGDDRFEIMLKGVALDELGADHFLLS
ncbi:hypothetical protein [Roseisalinus antarcticus]|uniref:Hemolysin, plasmid n=1 Tax=Roseisalinus antarcticus TaxID=254357 RepID=A0A1Y5T8X9_9RHOB|nr:hypothetical protein [Roseisalinus antarcticus]SLN58528.1 Hemolysin, plasmid [Roseisalinus antarcticus]